MPGAVQSIERASAVLQMLGHSAADVSLGEIAERLGLSKSTTHGIVATLRGVGFVDQDPRTSRYRLGRGLMELQSRPVDLHRLRSIATNETDSLAARSGESARVGALVDGEVVVFHHVFRPDGRPQELDVDRHLPPHACALGKVLLAHAPRAVRDRVPLTAYTSRTLTDRARFDAELAQVRAQGWAVEVGELKPDLAALAAPVHGPGALVVAAVAITGAVDVLVPSGRPDPALLEMVRRTGRAVSRDLLGT